MTLRKPLVINGGQTEQIQDGDALYFPFGSRVGEDTTYIDFVKRDIDFSIFSPGLIVPFAALDPNEAVIGKALPVIGGIIAVSENEYEDGSLSFAYIVDDVLTSAIDFTPDFTPGEETISLNANFDLGTDYKIKAEALMIGTGVDEAMPIFVVNDGLEDNPFLYYVGGDVTAYLFNMRRNKDTTAFVIGQSDNQSTLVISYPNENTQGLIFGDNTYGDWSLARDENKFYISYSFEEEGILIEDIDHRGDVNFHYNTYAQGRASTSNGLDTWLSKTMKDLTSDIGLENAARSIDTDGKYVYLGTYRDVAVCTLQIYDIHTDPANPVKVSPTVITDLPAHPIKGIKYQGGYLYISFEASGGDAFRIVDVTDPTNPIVKGGSGLTTLPDMGGGTTLDIEGDVCYVTSLDQVFAIDVSDKDNPTILDSIYPITGDDIPALWTCKVKNGYVFVGGRDCVSGYNHFRIIDATDPSDMSVIGGSGVDLPDGMWTLNVENIGNNTYVYIAAGKSFYESDNPKFYIIDATDKENPVIISSLLSEITSPCSYVKYVDGYCYLVCWGTGSGDDLYVIDVNDPEDPYVVSHAEYSNAPVTLAVHGRYLYLGFAPFDRPGTNYLGVIKQRGLASATAKFHDLSVGFWGERLDYTYKVIRDGPLAQTRLPLMEGSGKLYYSGEEIGEIETGVAFKNNISIIGDGPDNQAELNFANYNMSKSVYFSFDNDDMLFLEGKLGVRDYFEVVSEEGNADIRIHCVNSGQKARIIYGAGADYTEYFQSVYNPSQGILEEDWVDSEGVSALHKIYKTGAHDFIQARDISSGSFFYMIDVSENGFTASSGTQSFWYFSPKITQTDEAGYSAIKVDATEITTGSGDKRLIDLQVDGNEKFFVKNDGNVFIRTDPDSYFNTEALNMDLSVLAEGLEVTLPVLNGTIYNSMPEILPITQGVTVYDRLIIVDDSDSGIVEVVFGKNPLTDGSGMIGANLDEGYFWVNWDWCAQEDDAYSLGKPDLRWVDAWLSGKIYFVQADGDENITSLNDGYMDYSATTAHRFNKNLELTEKISKYNNVATDGYGIPAIVDVIELTGQTESISSTNIANTTEEGLYRVSFYLRSVNPEAGTPTVTLHIGWNDGVGNCGIQSKALPLTSEGYVNMASSTGFDYATYQQPILIKKGSTGSISYYVNLGMGDIGDASYNLYIVCERLK